MLTFITVNKLNLLVLSCQVCKKNKANDYHILNYILFIEGREVEPVLSVVILWRRDTSHVKYEWLNEKWEADETKLNTTTMKLENTISRLLRSTEALTYEALVKVCCLYNLY